MGDAALFAVWPDEGPAKMNKTTHHIPAGTERDRILAEMARMRSTGLTQQQIDAYYQLELVKHGVETRDNSRLTPPA